MQRFVIAVLCALIVTAGASALADEREARRAPFHLQLIASIDPDRPDALWSRMLRDHGDVLDPYYGFVQTIYLNGEDVYRLRVGPFYSRRAAEDVCWTLRDRGEDCVVAPNR